MHTYVEAPKVKVNHGAGLQYIRKKIGDSVALRSLSSAVGVRDFPLFMYYSIVII
jgi:hypothetical protein